MLDPKLDKLRNKELSFGCVIENAGKAGYILQADDKGLAIIMGLPYWVGNRTAQMNAIDRERIIGHPLTRGRICYLLDEYFRDPLTKNDAYVTLSIAKRKIGGFLAYYQLYDQNELERMKDAKRPELKELLIQFSNYL